MAIIGETLSVPEYGFTRYEFINKDDLTLNNEYFYGITASIIQDDNGLLAVGASNGGEILIKIKNTYRFRLLVCLPSSKNANTLYTNNMVVEIDGVEYTYDLTSNQNTTIIDNCLAVDISNLSTNSHIVKIYADGNNNDTQMINIQAIDIDTRGIVGFTRTMASMFEGCTNLKKDIIIPKNADVVENMFKNCTSMTHVHSNWDETYDDSGIITEDCYDGCSSITHIDDEALSLNEYTNGLDNIPPNWGGYGYTKEYTGVYRVEILSPNYTFSFASDGLLDNGYINWGDGTITQNEYSHTYVNVGVYTIKGQVHSTVETVTDSMKLCLKEILQYPIYGNLNYAFMGCTALISANISGNKYFDKNESRGSVFYNCTNLERVIALDTKLEVSVRCLSAFQGCNKLREIIGINDFLYNSNSIASCFHSCSSLQNFTLSEDSLKKCTTTMLAFYRCTSLTESPINTFVSDKSSLNISRIFELCTNITDISGVTFGENINVADGWYPPNLTTTNNVTIKNDVVKFTDCATLEYCNNLTLADNVTDISNLFSGCISLTHDIEIPSHITNCSNMFKGCTSMTHIRSNWENEYNSDIISTDCYSGCTALTHIDDENVIAYEGDNSLDYVPIEWGGNGLIDDGTVSILEVTIPSDNFALQLFTFNYGFSRRGTPTNQGWNLISFNNRINWGDGEVYKNDNSNGSDAFPTHTYAKAGIYYIKGHFGRFGADVTHNGGTYDFTPNVRYLITKVLKWAYLGHNDVTNVYKVTNLGYSFTGLNNVKSISGLKVTNGMTNLSGLCQDCSSLISIDFSGCDTSNITNMEYMFNRCSSLTSLDLSSLNMNNVTQISFMFNNCSSLDTLDLSSLAKTNDVEAVEAFIGCGVREIIGLKGIKLRGDISAVFMEMPNIVSLDFSGIDTSKATHIGNAWSGFVYKCPKLEYLDISGFSFEGAIDGRSHFGYFGMYCPSLKTFIARNCNTTECNGVYRMLEGCANLTYVDVSGMDLSNVPDLTDWNAPFRNCSSIVDFISFKNISASYHVFSNSLTVESLLSIIDNLVDTGESHTLKIGATNLAKLTSEQIKVATDKGWTIV